MTATTCSCGHDTTSPAPCDAPQCLSRPRFTAGQALEDVDLTALTSWVEGRLRRTRARHGWGAVEGLGVTVDPASPTGVVVARGYAVDCCGDDVVACEPLAVDVGACCGDAGGGDCADGYVPGPATGDTCVVDLALRRGETPADPRLGAGGAHGGRPRAEYTRLRETAVAVVTRVTAPDDDDPSEAWLTASRKCTSALFARVEAGAGDPEPLRRWWRAHPPTRFPFVVDAELIDGPAMAAALYWLAEDARAAFLADDPGPCCRAEHGVRLARVHLMAGEDGWRVIAVDDAPPRRRPWAPTRRPAPDGALNVAFLLLRPPGEVRTVLADLGVVVDEERPWSPTDVDAVRVLIETTPFVPAGARVVLRTLDVDDGPGAVLSGRVVAIEVRPGEGEDPGGEVPLEELRGLAAQRVQGALARAGIRSVADLADADTAAVQEATKASPEQAEAWVRVARRLRGPQ